MEKFEYLHIGWISPLLEIIMYHQIQGASSVFFKDSWKTEKRILSDDHYKTLVRILDLLKITRIFWTLLWVFWALWCWDGWIDFSMQCIIMSDQIFFVAGKGFSVHKCQSSKQFILYFFRGAEGEISKM